MAFVRKLYIGDTHFMHEGLLSMQPRPFGSIEEHDEAIIERWNAVVRDRDIVYHLGDFAVKLMSRADRVREIFTRLRGRKRLVIGNHDLGSDFALHPTLASLPWDEPPQFMAFTKDAGCHLVLCHYGIREWQWKRKGGWHFYAHAHGKLPSYGNSRDVGCDMPDVDFTPRAFEELAFGKG